MKRTHLLALAACLLLATQVAPAAAGQTASINQTGPHGGTVTGSETQRGNTAAGNATVTGPNGNTATSSDDLTYKDGQVDGTVSGTGPKGNSGTADVTAQQGSATVNGSGGRSHTFSRK